MSFFKELSRRNVIRVGLAYVITAWLMLQVADVVLGNITAPEWVFQAILLILGLGFPVAMLFAWAYELTPDGLRREKDVDRSISVTHETGRKLDRAIIVVLALAVVYFAVDKFVLPESPRSGASADDTRAATTGRQSIAVLPFVNMSSDPEQEYFSDGVSEELLNLLAKIPQFQVAGRTSSFAFKGENNDLRQIGESLGVTTILEGSVRKGSDSVRITAQLINVEDGFHLWSETYDRELIDIFAVQDEIAAAVVDELKVTLLGDAPTHSQATETLNADAYNDYLHGLFYLNRVGPDNTGEAVTHFEAAVAKDSGFALAWAGLARASVRYATMASGSTDNHLQRARDAVRKALEIDPALPEAHIAKGLISSSYDWDWDAAEASFQRALELRPGDVRARMLLGNVLKNRGRIAENLKITKELLRVDPLNELLQVAHVTALILADQDDAAEPILLNALRQNPELNFGYTNLSWIRYRAGLLDESVEYAEKERVDFARWTMLAVAHFDRGDLAKAQEYQQKVFNEYGDLASYQQAQIFSHWGQPDIAVEWLEKAYAVRDPGLTNVKVDQSLASLRDHPRYIALLEQMKL